ncbi:MAG: bacillithiol biosynthesis cysteine-adding enzyme BshC [Gemmatimonadales bacterium]
MSVRIVPTPLVATVSWPVERAGGIAPALLPAFAAGSDEQRTRLTDPRVLVVTTGQQPGLLTGPLYTIHKALSTVALARQLEARWQRPVVPVFWAAGDDHDFAEGNHAVWLGGEGAPVTVTLRERAQEEPLTPLYRELLGPEIGAVLERLAADLPPSEFRDQTLAQVGRHYRPDATLAQSCSGLLMDWLSPLGLVVFDPTHPAAKRVQAPWLIRALEDASDVEARLVARNGELLAHDIDAGIAVGDGATLVMLEGKTGRDRLVRTGADFTTRRSGERFSIHELRSIAAGTPMLLSANVLLRAAIESALLPTVAYVAGPGELRYLQLASAVYPALDIPRQLPLPRWSGILVETRVDRVLEKFTATLDELLTPGQRLEARVVRSQMPPEVEPALAALRQVLTQQYAVLATAAAAIDPTIEKPIHNLAQQALSGTQDAEKRLMNHLKKRQATETQQIARARDAVFPLGKPQERVLTLAPFLARYGPDLLTNLLESIEEWYRAALDAAAGPA